MTGDKDDHWYEIGYKEGRSDAAADVERLTRIAFQAQEMAKEQFARADAAERKVERLRKTLENILQNVCCTNQSVVAVVNLSLLVEARAALAETETKE